MAAWRRFTYGRCRVRGVNHMDDSMLRETGTRVSRRQIISAAVAGATGMLVGGCRSSTTTGPLSDDALIVASALSGERLSLERVRSQRPVLEFILEQVQIMREFDPGEQEPATMFEI